MANEIYATFNDGETLYALIWRKTDDKVFNNTTNAFVTYTDAAIDDLDIPLTNIESVSDYYSADFPTAITDAGVYRVQIMLQAGVTIDADLDTGLFQGEISWDGTAEINIYTLDTSINVLNASGSRVLNVYGAGE